MILRELARADLPEVRALWASCEGLGDGPGDSLHALETFLARNPGISPVALVAVAPSHRRSGIARALAERAFDGLRKAGIARGMMFILADNDEAQAFWQSVGAKRRETLELWSVDL